MDARNIRRPGHVTRADFGLPATPTTRAKTLLNTKAKAFLESLPILALADLRLDSLECPFCIEPYQNSPHSERPVRLPCNHVMGNDCLRKWLNSSGANANNNACPTCRAVLFERGDELDDDSEDETPPPQPRNSATLEQLVDLRRDVHWYSIGPKHLRMQGQYEQIRDALSAFEASADIMSAAEASVLRLKLEQASIPAEYRMRRRREHTGEPEQFDRSNDTVSGLLARGRAHETPTYRVRDRISERSERREDALRPVLVREGRRAEGTQSRMQTNQDLGTWPERLSPRYHSSRTFSGLGRGDTETVVSRSRVEQSQGWGRERRDPREDALRPGSVTGRLRAEAANRMRSGYAGMSWTRTRDDDLAE